ncbi:DUF2971 domain-containing protein [Priestia megaterium]|nr:DUF2971 domain-containing protein [Priestia megaterium]
MDLDYKQKAYQHAMGFESSYDYYDEQYKVKDNPSVWRYMDMFKFQSLLESKALFFVKPNAFLDPFEGSYSMWNIKEMKDSDKLNSRSLRTYMKKIHDFSAVSCWHINEYESAGMWDLYANSYDGIAIKTSYDNLLHSIKDLRYKVFARKVQYIDFSKGMASENIYDTLFFKRKSFSYENELRLLILANRIDAWKLQKIFLNEGIYADEWQPRMEILKEKSYQFSHENGNLIRCDLSQLIGEIYVSPKSSLAFVDQVKTLVKQHGLSHKKIIQSDLSKDYIY